MTDAEKVQELCQAVWNFAIASWRVSTGVYPAERVDQRYSELLDLAQRYGVKPPDDVAASRDAADRMGRAFV